MALTSLKMKREPEDNSPVETTDEPYGYGTRLHLAPEQVKALGMENIKVGTEIALVAKAKIAGANVRENGGMCMDIQLTDMSVKKDNPLESLYDNKN